MIPTTVLVTLFLGDMEEESIDTLRLFARWTVLEPPAPCPLEGALEEGAKEDTSALKLVVVDGLAPSLAFNCVTKKVRENKLVLIVR